MNNLSFSASDFRERALAHRRSADDVAAAFRDHGDHQLNPDLVADLERVASRDAAVLIPVIDDHASDARIILTMRAKALRKHSGQIAFPGGAIDPEDASPEAAAMREAQEEISLDPRFVEPVGRLPLYLTMTGFRITPVLALVKPGFRLQANPEEVDDVFEVPLSFLMTPGNHFRESRVWQGRERHYYTMPYNDRFIWGVTAGILRTLYERLYA
ncbi:CoA pyrophosphatase [Pararhizobium haloflavum]|uniref:CoA pyrophosphatase n=1 Tax=Pararhizobium haloflavum TaxID=2037914 RepID=UPI000C1970FC|nr:CoA pyrophosphatase [Pararhizobium haloflavum]